MTFKKVKIPIKSEERNYTETDTEVIILLGGIKTNMLDGILRIKESIEKKGKKLVLALKKPNTMSKTLGITYSHWCKNHGIRCQLMPMKNAIPEN